MTVLKNLLIVCTLTLAACSEAPPARDYKAEIEARDAAFETAYNSGDAASVAAFYTEDAVIMPPGYPTLNGTGESEWFWNSTMESGLKRIEFIPDEITGFGDTAIDRGRFIAYDAEGNEIATGKYLVIWKFVDGEWKLYNDIWNLDI